MHLVNSTAYFRQAYLIKTACARSSVSLSCEFSAGCLQDIRGRKPDAVFSAEQNDEADAAGIQKSALPQEQVSSYDVPYILF